MQLGSNAAFGAVLPAMSVTPGLNQGTSADFMISHLISFPYMTDRGTIQGMLHTPFVQHKRDTT